MSALKIATVDNGDLSDLAGVLAIYHDSFPRIERKSDAAICEIFLDVGYRIDLVRRDGAVAGFALTKLLGGDLALLEYMAIDRSHRGEGLGGALFEHVKSMTGDGVLLLEVELVAASPADADQIRRRMAFYRGHGCRDVEGLDYILPLHRNAVARMRILVWAAALPPAVKKDAVAYWIRRLYESVYQVSVDDPRIETMLSGLGDEVVLA